MPSPEGFCQPVRATGLTTFLPVQPTERHKPTRMGAVEPIEVRFEGATPVAVEIDDRLDIAFFHEGHQPPDVLDRPATLTRALVSRRRTPGGGRGDCAHR